MASSRVNFRKSLKYFWQRMRPAVLAFVAIQTVLRVALFMRAATDIDFSLPLVFKALSIGLVFDLAALSFFLIPFALYLLVFPAPRHAGKADRVLTQISFVLFLYILLFDVLAEWVFWDEFSTRFNFIAVDYLVYTQEVLGNIWESYPVGWLLFFEAIVTALLFMMMRPFLFPDKKPVAPPPFRSRLAAAAVVLLFPAVAFFAVDLRYAEASTNSFVQEVSKNGIYSLFSAYRNNELDYGQFYITSVSGQNIPPIRDLLEESELGHKFVNDDPDDITRIIRGKGPEKHKNVIIVVMESMSGAFMQRFGSKDNLTPRLDGLVGNSLFFSNTYATGTRTVRGLEAISLSIPPSPGTSILRKQGNENLFSLGFVFRDRGYDTRFIYGGHGYFDNMNYFFANNGFDIVDRTSFASDEVTFSNIWGVCDEDLFNKVMKEASASYASHKPFMHIVMTTSNHRPYTFPEGHVDLPPGSSGHRASGVKYADYAIGKFLDDAHSQPWFKDTVFVIVADHTAGSAGKEELSPDKYHIPLFFYSPSFIQPREIPNMISQIDVAPILLDLLDFTYYSRFYGEDILSDPDEQAHAFISTYEKLGFIDGKSLAVLKPGRALTYYVDGEPVSEISASNDALALETISFYSHAAGWREHSRRINSVVEDAPLR